ncbi:MAG: pyridoxal-phosphate dependent enzyme, partial [Actinomycetia bacterium]|nr:pyridoxal-phosphate dependent enzyme [Actinomycetes bacterium]
MSLGSWPTPLEGAPKLSAAIGLLPDDLWVKRDDLTGLGGGGNKVRKLEWLCAQALRDGATMLVTSGAAQSNHARITAAAGARLGLPVVLVLRGSGQTPSRGNVVLDELFGATIVWVDVDNLGELANHVEGTVADLRREGHHPALISLGGSTTLSANAYEAAAEELLLQGPSPDHVVVALGTGATMAGLVRRLGADHVLGVHCGAIDEPGRMVAELTNQAPATTLEPQLRIRYDQVGRGYAHLNPTVMDAMKLAAHTEGIVLDPVYTGRALAGLIAAVRDGDVRPGERTILMHTGGLPGIFGHDELLTGLAS